jgi:rhomboid family GlyGly-CTERM serine protease
MGLRELKDNEQKSTASLWLIPGIIIGISLLILLTGEAGRELLRYDRVWIGQGETWRFLSGHVTHLGASHLALNGAGLLLVWFLVGSAYAMRNWVLIIAITLIVMNLGFWFLMPELYWYVGMSGLLHGLLVAGIVPKLRQIDAETVVLIILLLAKVGWEQLNGPVPGSELSSGGPVIVNSHLYGLVGGVLGALLVMIRVKRSAPI